MYRKKIPDDLDCGISVVFRVLGGKWKAWIIECIDEGFKRPSQLHREMHQVSPRVINMHLRELEEYGIIDKIVYMQLPLKVEYFLTEVGKSLLPVIRVMDDWGREKKDYVIARTGTDG